MNDDTRLQLAEIYGARSVAEYEKEVSERQNPSQTATASGFLAYLVQTARAAWKETKDDFNKLYYTAWRARMVSLAVRNCCIDLESNPALKDVIAKLGEWFFIDLDPRMDAKLGRAQIIARIRKACPASVELADADALLVFANEAIAEVDEANETFSHFADYCKKLLEKHLRTIGLLGLSLTNDSDLFDAVKKLKALIPSKNLTRWEDIDGEDHKFAFLDRLGGRS